MLGECDCMPSLTIAQCVVDGGIVCVDLTTGNDGGCWSPECLGCAPANCCSGECTDFTSDPNNCGACGNTCISGSCILGDDGGGICNCPLPYTQCGPICVNTYSDVTHCGSCDAGCALPATECMLGKCQ